MFIKEISLEMLIDVPGWGTGLQIDEKLAKVVNIHRMIISYSARDTI